jgi:hypothetical protein
VHKLRVQLPYSHNLAVVESLALWPVDVHVKSTIQDITQVHYAEAPQNEWEFAATVLPNRGSGERLAGIRCIARTTGKNEVLSLFTRDTGQQDTLVLELVIDETDSGDSSSAIRR